MDETPCRTARGLIHVCGRAHERLGSGVGALTVVGALLLAGAALAAGLSHGVLLNASIDRPFSHPRPGRDQSGRMGGMRVGDSATLTFTVTADDTAAAMG